MCKSPLCCQWWIDSNNTRESFLSLVALIAQSRPDLPASFVAAPPLPNLIRTSPRGHLPNTEHFAEALCGNCHSLTWMQCQASAVSPLCCFSIGRQDSSLICTSLLDPLSITGITAHSCSGRASYYTLCAVNARKVEGSFFWGKLSPGKRQEEQQLQV